MHLEQQFLKPQHFRKFKRAIVWGRDSKQLQEELPHIENEMGIWIHWLDKNA